MEFRRLVRLMEQAVESMNSYIALRQLLLSTDGHKRVSPEDKEQIILAAGQKDARASELLVLLYDRWARQMARKFATKRKDLANLDVEDLEQEARCGLLHAATKWDPARGAFTTYAKWWLLSYMERGPNSGASTITVPVHAHQTESTRKYVEQTRWVGSLDETLNRLPFAGNDSVKTLMDVVANDSVASDVDHDVVRIEAFLELVPPPQRRALEKYYLEEMTLEQVAQTEGVTREAIRQRIVLALTKIRKGVKRR